MDESGYTKEELKRAERFARYADLIEALFKKDVEYTVGEAEEIIRRFMEGSV